MIGLLVDVKPWFLEDPDVGELKRLGDLLTFKLEEHPPLKVQYLYPKDSTPQRFPLSGKYVIRDIEITRVEANPGYCFDADGTRLLNIKKL